MNCNVPQEWTQGMSTLVSVSVMQGAMYDSDINIGTAIPGQIICSLAVQFITGLLGDICHKCFMSKQS